MKFKTEDYERSCGCRSVGECNHNQFAWMQALDGLVDSFAEEMKKKLRAKFLEGKSGWDDEEWSIDDIKRQATNHIDKGDPVDVANFAAFWWNKL